MKAHYRLTLLGGILFLMIPFLASILTVNTDQFSLIFGILFLIGFAGGITLLCFGMMQYMKTKSDITDDERTKKIGYKASTYTFSVTLFFILIVTIPTQYHFITVSSIQLYWIILFPAGVTLMVLTWQLNKKPDV